MKKLRWQLLIIFITGLVVGFLLLGEQPEPVSQVASPEPVKGGVYTEALIGSLLRLNPLLSLYNAADQDVSRLLFSGLVRFDSKGVAQPDLADTMGYSQDGTLYNFTLRKDALWHDGEPVTADDVLYTVELLREGAGIIPQDLQDFWKEVEVVKLSQESLQFRLPAAFAPFFDYLSFGLLPSHLLAGQSLEQLIDAPFNLEPVGSGPYRFNQLLVEDGQIQGVALKVNEQYYGEKPYIEEIVFRYYPDPTGALQAYRDGQVQGIAQVTPDILKDVLAEPDLAVFTARRPELSMLMFNLNNPEAEFLQDVKVRRALLQGLNRQWIVDRILNSQAVVANGPILPGTWAYYEGLESEAFDPEAARSLLKEAGFVLTEEGDVVRKKGEQALRFILVFPDDETHQAVAEYIRDSWNALGAQVELEGLPYDQLITTRLDPRSFEAALVDLNLARSPDPDPYPFWDQAQATVGQNYTQWNQRIASEYLEQARITVNLAERARLYRNFQIIFNQDLPALALYYPVYTYAVDREVQGVRVGPLFDLSDRFRGISDWFLTSEQQKPINANSLPVPIHSQFVGRLTVAVESDWVLIKTALPDLQSYILSSEVYWTLRPPSRSPGGAQVTQLTIGNLLLSQARLAAPDLPASQRTELADLQQRILAVRSEWRANWGRKADQEFHSRLNLWQQYLREVRGEARRSAAIYAQQVRLRVILQLLQPELSQGVPANEQEQLTMLDTVLHGLLRPGPFIWEPEIAHGFPQESFWFLYGSIGL